jgi:predicted Zn-dependent peptidase
VLETIRALRDGKITDAELAAGREVLLARWRESMASVEGPAALYATASANGVPFEATRTFPARIARLGRDDLVKVATRYLGEANLHVLFVGYHPGMDVRSLRLGALGTVELGEAELTEP